MEIHTEAAQSKPDQKPALKATILGSVNAKVTIVIEIKNVTHNHDVAVLTSGTISKLFEL